MPPAAAAAALKRQSAVYGVEINMFEYVKVAGEAGKQGSRDVDRSRGTGAGECGGGN